MTDQALPSALPSLGGSAPRQQQHDEGWTKQGQPQEPEPKADSAMSEKEKSQACGVAHEDVPNLPCTLPHRHDGRHEVWGANVLLGWWAQTEREHYYRGWNDCMDWVESVDAERRRDSAPLSEQEDRRGLPRFCPTCGVENPDAFHLHYHGAPAPSTWTLQPMCPTHRVPMQTRVLVVQNTTVGTSEPMAFSVCSLCDEGASRVDSVPAVDPFSVYP